MKTKKDINGNFIGDGTIHALYNIHDFKKEGYDFIESSVSKSNTSESVYVTYTNTHNKKSVSVRFSNHTSNSVKFGDVLTYTDVNEILYRLGLKGKKVINGTRPFILTEFLKKKDVAKYEEAELTIQDMYALGVGADISAYKGKVAKGGRSLICGDKIEEVENSINVKIEYYDI
ncbi:hypothetical protein [Prevotella falsenii]|uniref:hypothetical protein n=1 Tax=Prevotella falsenii TaxID=515414 RepID=UPI000468ABE1|nr:hypothetical protein [Prevotella falsenii]